MEKLKATLLGPYFPFRGGIAQHTVFLSRELEKKVDLQKISFSRQYPKFIYPFESDRDETNKADPGVRFVVDTVNPLTWLKTALSIGRRTSQWIILPWWHIFFFPAFFTIALLSRIRGVRVCILCHNVLDHEAARWKAFFTRLVFRLAHALVVHTSEEKERLRALGLRQPVMIHPLPIFDQFSAKAKPKAPGAASKRILFFGFVRPYKGLNVLIDAIPHLSDRNIVVDVVGDWLERDSDLYKRCQTLAKTGAINLHDHYVSDEDVAQYFLNADVVVLPYIEAAGSAVVTVAYAFRKPVVASSIGCFVDLVRNGESGILVPPGDALGLARGITQALDLDKNRVALSIEELASGLTWDHLASSICSFLQANQ